MTSDNLEFIWPVSYAIVTKETISQYVKHDLLLDSPGFRKTFNSYSYNVFLKDRLYETFSRINTDDIKSIEDFVNQFGILGIEFENKEEVFQSKVNQYRSAIKNAINDNTIERLQLFTTTNDILESTSDYMNIEIVTDFSREVLLMRSLLELNSFEYQHIKVNEMERIKAKIKYVADLAYIDFTYNGDNEIPDFRLLEHAIKGLISSIINIKVKNVQYRLELKYSPEDKSFIYVESWEPKSLLGCMYLMLSINLSQGRKMKVCSHCQYPFTVMDDRESKYCSRNCRLNANTKQTRERMAKSNQLYVEGCSIDDIYIKINEQSKKEIKLETIKKWVGYKEE